MQSAPTLTPASVHAAEAVLTVAHVSKSLGDHHVLQDFSLTLYRGENPVVLGQSGSGKSVLIKRLSQYALD